MAKHASPGRSCDFLIIFACGMLKNLKKAGPVRAVGRVSEAKLRQIRVDGHGAASY